jgi:hypothetical protein
MDSLLAAGYEIKAASVLSIASAKEMWPNQNLGPQVLVSLQKGPSIAVCVASTTSWLNLDPTTMNAPTQCEKRG